VEWYDFPHTLIDTDMIIQRIPEKDLTIGLLETIIPTKLSMVK
jgi:hypothetical protein